MSSPSGEAVLRIAETNARIAALAAEAAARAAADATLYAAIGSLATGNVAQDTFLVSGGQVVWESAYNFRVSAAGYYIDGTLYSSLEQTITLTAAHATLDRIDVIAVDDTGTVVKVDGTAAAQPSEPDVDPGTQLKLSIVYVAANTTAPATAATVSLYAEHAGSPTEWDWTTSGTGFNVNSTAAARTGTHSIEGTTVAAGAYAQGAKGTGTLDPNAYSFLVFYIKSKATWAAKRTLQISLRNAGVVKGTTLTLADGAWGFSSANTTTFQQIAIPVASFAVPAGTLINQLRFTDAGGSIGFYLDDVVFSISGGSVQVTGLTQDQADARYQPKDATLTALAALDATVGLLKVTGLDTFARIPTGVAAATDVLTRADGDGRFQPVDATLTALAALDATVGLVKVTGADTFTRIPTGVAAATDVLTRADGDGRFAALSHAHAAADITSGVLAMARLATGTPNGTLFVRDDGTLAVPPGASGSSLYDPPSSPHAANDEFTTASLSNIWTQLTTPAAGFTVAYNRDGTFLAFDSPGGTVAATNHLLIRQNPALGAGSAISIVSRFFMSSYSGGDNGTNYVLFQMSDNAAESTGNYLHVALLETGESFTVSGSTNAGNQYSAVWGPGAGELWVLYQRDSGNVVRIYASLNGRTWRRLWKATLTWNVSYIYLDLQGHSGAGTLASTQSVDFLRVNDSRFTQFVA